MNDEDSDQSLGVLFAQVEQGLKNQIDFEELQNACERELWVLCAAWVFHSKYVDKRLNVNRISNVYVVTKFIDSSFQSALHKMPLQIDLSDEFKEESKTINQIMFFVPNAVYAQYDLDDSDITSLKDERPFYMIPNDELPPELREKQVSITQTLFETARELNEFMLHDIRNQYFYRYPLDHYMGALLLAAKTSSKTLCHLSNPMEWLLAVIKEVNGGQDEMSPHEFYDHTRLMEIDPRQLLLH